MNSIGEVVAYICFTILVITLVTLLSGEPDLLDAIVSRTMEGGCK